MLTEVLDTLYVIQRDRPIWPLWSLSLRASLTQLKLTVCWLDSVIWATNYKEIASENLMAQNRLLVMDYNTIIKKKVTEPVEDQVMVVIVEMLFLGYI